MAGLGRLWYSLIFMWNRYPLCLILLATVVLSDAEKTLMVEQLLDTFDNGFDCCIDDGFTLVLLLLAWLRSGILLPDGCRAAKRAMELSFLLSPRLRLMAVYKFMAITLSISVFDLECLNATLRRIHSLDRCPILGQRP